MSHPRQVYSPTRARTHKQSSARISTHLLAELSTEGSPERGVLVVEIVLRAEKILLLLIRQHVVARVKAQADEERVKLCVEVARDYKVDELTEILQSQWLRACTIQTRYPRHF